MKTRVPRFLGLLSIVIMLVFVHRAWEYPRVWSDQRRARGLTADELIAELSAENWIAGERLAEMGEDAVPALMTALRGDSLTRARAAAGLIWNAEAAADTLARHWATTDADTADATHAAFTGVSGLIYSLPNLGPQPDTTSDDLRDRFWRVAHATLRGGIANPDPAVRDAAWKTTYYLSPRPGALDPEGAEAIVFSAWDSGDVRLYQIIRLLPKELPERWLTEDNRRLRWTVALANPAAHTEVLFEATRSDDKTAVAAAAGALGRIWPTNDTIVDGLTAMVRIKGRAFAPAIAALDRIGRGIAAAAPALLDVAEDEAVDHATRLLAIDAAAKAGAPDERTLSIVRAILQASNDDAILNEADRQMDFYR